MVFKSIVQFYYLYSNRSYWNYNLNDPIEISKLFDNFYKGDKSRHKDSTGLGLSIVKEICLILHWEIEARQEDDDVIIQINTNNNSIYLEEKDV
mgnify:CR=1 FL=1